MGLYGGSNFLDPPGGLGYGYSWAVVCHVGRGKEPKIQALTTPHMTPCCLYTPQKGGVPKIRGTILGVPIIRTLVFWGLHWGPPILGNYHIPPKMGVS